MAKTFAKIAKTFAGLSTTIIATRRRLVLILHLEAKYAKIDCKNEIYAKNCCDGGSDVESGITPIKTRLPRKSQSSGSDTMLNISIDTPC